jgi:hypothetical protein
MFPKKIHAVKVEGLMLKLLFILALPFKKQFHMQQIKLIRYKFNIKNFNIMLVKYCGTLSEIAAMFHNTENQKKIPYLKDIVILYHTDKLPISLSLE